MRVLCSGSWAEPEEVAGCAAGLDSLTERCHHPRCEHGLELHQAPGPRTGTRTRTLNNSWPNEGVPEGQVTADRLPVSSLLRAETGTVLV